MADDGRRRRLSPGGMIGALVAIAVIVVVVIAVASGASRRPRCPGPVEPEARAESDRGGHPRVDQINTNP